MRHIVIVCATLLAGCGMSEAQREAVKDFSKATAAFGTTAATELPAMRSGMREMNAAYYVFATPPEALRPKAIHPYNLTGALELETLLLHVRLSKALSQYGAALLTLLESEAPSKAKDSIADIGSSLGDIPGFADSADRIKAVGAGLSGIAGLILEDARWRAVRDIVNSSDAFVQEAAGLLANDFRVENCPPANGCGIAYFYRNAALFLDAQARSGRPLLRIRPPGSAERQAVMHAAETAQRHADAASTMPPEGLKAALEIGRMHAELKAKLADDSRAADMSQLLAAAKAFAAAGTAFKRD